LLRSFLRSLTRIILPLAWFASCACNNRSTGARADHARLFDGMGEIHHRIATTNPEAQKFFDQGLALVYAFNFGEAINSFQHAAELDPNSAMPYWGMALANGPNYNAWIVSRDHERAGFDAIQTAVGLAPNAPEQERAYIDALARCFTDESAPDQPRLAHDYSNAMREVYRRYPDDPDAAVLFAASLMNLNPWHLWKIDGQPRTDTSEIVTVLEEALRRWPEHTGVNHFYVHTMEGSPYPEGALPSAQRLETLAPAAGHLVHMSSHIYLRIGDYAAAVKSNEKAIAADRNYQREQPVATAGVMGYSNHNQLFLAVAASMDGEFETARNAAKAIESHTHSEAMAVMSTLVLLRFARWDEVLRLPAPDPQLTAVAFFWHVARGCAFASKRRLKEEADEQAAMEEAFSRLPEGRAFGTFFNDWSTLHALAVDTLAARIAEARGDLDAAIGYWRHAVAIEDNMNFDDVPDWYYPIRESLGATLLRNKQASEAEQVFREDLKRNPRNPRSLFGLSKALEARQNTYAANLVRQSFEAAWRGKELPRIEDF
jgi:tetratricopeptide (TPR) repeat protein